MQGNIRIWTETITVEKSLEPEQTASTFASTSIRLFFRFC